MIGKDFIKSILPGRYFKNVIPAVLRPESSSLKKNLDTRLRGYDGHGLFSFSFVSRCPWLFICFLALALALASSVVVFAEEPVSGEIAAAKEAADTGNINLEAPASKDREDAGKISLSSPLKSEWGTGIHKSYLIPALEVVGLDALINGYDRLVYKDTRTEDGKKVYETNPATFWDNLAHGHWGIDRDNFKMNQLLHPYHGSLYHGLARSAGLGYWESMGYTIAGSFLWETAGETSHPSINDMVATGIGGSFFGEPLFRIANLLLEHGGEKPSIWRELAAALISPPTGFNRLVFGEKFKPVFPSHDPAVFWNLRAGAILNTNPSGHGSTTTVSRNEATMDFALAYGLPGKPGYSYTRPFDYFRADVASLNSTRNPFENIMVHGLLIGSDYEGNSYRGIWGLYGSYDYISPHFFRVSTSAASIGTTAQKWLSKSVALQGTILGGVGYGSGGTTSGSGERDYHYGVTPQGLLAFRLILGDIAAIDATIREYFVSAVGGTEQGRENIVRANAGLTVRIYGHHAIGIQYVASRRDAHYPGLSEIEQRAGTLSLVYSLLSDTRFGAVEWRNISKD